MALVNKYIEITNLTHVNGTPKPLSIEGSRDIAEFGLSSCTIRPYTTVTLDIFIIQSDELFIDNLCRLIDSGDIRVRLEGSTATSAVLGLLKYCTLPTSLSIASESTDTTCFPLFVTAATGDLALKTNPALKFNSNTGALATSSLVLTGALGLTGTRVLKGWFTDLECTNAIAGSITGNAATVTVADESTDTTCFPLFVTGALGSQGPKTVATFTFNSNTGALASTSFTANTITANTGFVPDANDGAYLGTTALGFSDLFLAEGGVINWDNGDVTVTQTGDTLNVAGGNLLVGTTNNTGTPATGTLVVRGSTADGTTNCLVLRDSAEANVFSVNTDGNVYANWIQLTMGVNNYGNFTNWGYTTNLVDSSNNGVIFQPVSQSAFNFAVGNNADANGIGYNLAIVSVLNYTNNYSCTVKTNPTLSIYSATAAATATDQWLSACHDVTNGVVSTGKGALSLTPFSGVVSMGTATVAGSISMLETKGASFGIQSATVELTIPVGQGSGGVVTASIIPAATLVLGATFFVTQAPGGGAATWKAGVTGGASDGLAVGVSTAASTGITSCANATGGTLTGPVIARTASTITVTTDADVTVSDMKLRIVVTYMTEGTPTA